MDLEATKRYAENFKTIAGVRGCTINFHPADAPTTVKILHDGQGGSCSILCEYTPESMYKAYYNLVINCGADVSVHIKKMQDKSLDTTNFWEGKRNGEKTPEMKVPNVFNLYAN